jgi:topoisomerase-4 subunit A
MDASEYDHGRGKVKLRAKIDIKDPKTLVIREICYGTTTESLIRSIDEAAKKGKIKIESIDDYTAQEVEIEIKLPRGVYAEELIDALYAFTECQVSLNSQVIVVKEQLPWETDVKQVLQFHADKLQEYLRKELEIEKGRLEEKIFQKTLEQIFIENKIYKKIEAMKTFEAIHQAVEEGLKPFHKELSRVPQAEDRDKLLALPIRRISQFDLEKNKKEIGECKAAISEIEKHLKQVKRFTIKYLKDLIKQFGKDFPRRTVNASIEALNLKAIATKAIKVGVDYEGGFIGTKVSSTHMIECTNFDKLLLMFNGGGYKVINIPEKQYVGGEGEKLIYAAPADKKTVMTAVYKNPKTRQVYGKRFVVDKFILEKPYRFLEEGMALELLTAFPAPKVQLVFAPKAKQKFAEMVCQLEEVLVKGVSARGVRLSPREVRKVNSLDKTSK